jgi:hypothetical protein
MNVEILLNYLRKEGKAQLLTIDYEKSIEDAIELMIQKEYSQIPVTKKGEIIGIISHQSIVKWLCLKEGRGDLSTEVAYAMDDKNVIGLETSLSALVDFVALKNYVLVKDNSRYEIITNHGILQYFKDFSESFMLIENIEKKLRSLITSQIGRNSFAELSHNTLGRPGYDAPSRVEDMVFNDYKTFISKNREFFTEILNISQFLDSLDRIRNIRNSVFHFREMPSELELTSLQQFNNLLDSFV